VGGNRPVGVYDGAGRRTGHLDAADGTGGCRSVIYPWLRSAARWHWHILHSQRMGCRLRWFVSEVCHRVACDMERGVGS
jgi:hypothetical protein